MTGRTTLGGTPAPEALVIVTAPPDVPRALVVAGRWWVVAIGAAVLETVLAAGHALMTPDPSGPTPSEVLAQVLVRLVVFAAAGWLTLELVRGRNAARIALTVLLSTLGLFSLLIAPVEWLASGHRLSEAFRDLGLSDVAFVASRVVHVLAVVLATVFMYQRSANRYLGAFPRRPAEDQRGHEFPSRWSARSAGPAGRPDRRGPG